MELVGTGDVAVVVVLGRDALVQVVGSSFKLVSKTCG